MNLSSRIGDEGQTQHTRCSTQPTLVAFRYTSVETLDRYATNVKGICGSLCATGWTHICPSCRPSRCISRSQVGHKQEQNLHGHRASWIHMTTASSTLANPLSLNFPISNVCPESVPPPSFRDCEKFRKKNGSRNNPHVEEQSLVCSWHKNIGEMKRKSEI